MIDHILAELVCGDDEWAEQAALHISRLRIDEQQEAMLKLQAMLASPLVEQRWWACRALAGIPDPRVAAWLAELLQDEALVVRQCAALGLRLHPTEEAIPALICLLDEDDALLARLAGDALAAVGAAAVPSLIEVVQRQDSETVPPGRHAPLEAVRALSAVGDARAIPVLFELVGADSALLSYLAEQGLERMGLGMVYFTP